MNNSKDTKMDTAGMIVKAVNFHGQQLSKIMEDKQLKILGSINIRDVDYHAYQQRAKDLRYALVLSCVHRTTTLGNRYSTLLVQFLSGKCVLVI